MCFDWLKRRFQHEKTREEKEKLRKDIEAKILADYRRQVAKTGKIVNISSHGGPTMPKYQPCPNCYGDSKRNYKTEDGAFYKCVKHGVFFVKRMQRKPHIPVAQHSK